MATPEAQRQSAENDRYPPSTNEGNEIDIEKGPDYRLKDYSDSSRSTPLETPSLSPESKLELPGTESPEVDESQTPPAPPPLDWDGPDDPDNPMNWSLLKKSYHFLPPSLMCFLM